MFLKKRSFNCFKQWHVSFDDTYKNNIQKSTSTLHWCQQFLNICYVLINLDLCHSFVSLTECSRSQSRLRTATQIWIKKQFLQLDSRIWFSRQMFVQEYDCICFSFELFWSLHLDFPTRKLYVQNRQEQRIHKLTFESTLPEPDPPVPHLHPLYLHPLYLHSSDLCLLCGCQFRPIWNRINFPD